MTNLGDGGTIGLQMRSAMRLTPNHRYDILKCAKSKFLSQVKQWKV